MMSKSLLLLALFGTLALAAEVEVEKPMEDANAEDQDASLDEIALDEPISDEQLAEFQNNYMEMDREFTEGSHEKWMVH